MAMDSEARKYLPTASWTLVKLLERRFGAKATLYLTVPGDKGKATVVL